MERLVQPTANATRVYLFGAFILLYILSVFIHLGYLPLNGEEPRRAVVSIEMLESGNYIMPTTMGWEYYNKPPMYNWIISFFMYITGSTSEAAVRLPSLFFILTWGACNYLLMKRFFPRAIAALSSLFLVTSFDIFFWGLSNGGEIDIFYSFIVYLQVIFIFYFNQRKKWTALFTVSYLFCAIGFLTKGFPSLLFEGLTLLAACAYNRSIRLVFRWQHLAGLAVFTILVGGYLYAYSFYSSPSRLLANLLKEAFNKSALGEHPERFLKKVIAYPLSFFKLLLPWSLILLLLFKKHRFTLWQHPLLRFSLLFLLFNIPVYWFTGIPKMRYVYMFLPFCMIILAYILYKFREEYPGLLYKTTSYLSLVFVAVLIAIVIVPFFISVEFAWLFVAVALISVYIVKYGAIKRHPVLYFAAGIVLLRFIYASVFIPVQYEHSRLKYDKQMAELAMINHFKPVSIYMKPEILDLTIDLKISRLRFGTFPAIPYLSYQMPYYYYRASGHVVKYDTTLQNDKSYIGFRSALGGLPVHIMQGFKDKNQHDEEIVLFSISPEPGGATAVR